MIKGTIDLDISCSPSRTYNYLVQPERQSEWIPDVLSTEPEIGKESNLFRQSIAVGDSVADGFLQLTECRNKEFISYNGGGGPVRFWSEFVITPSISGTHIRHVYRIELKGIFRLVQPLFKHQAKTNSQLAMHNLAQQLSS